jgi:hypothetical protein
MNPFKRFLTAFIFYPILVLWFIPKEFVRAYRKVGRIWEGKEYSYPERFEEAKMYFKQELRVAMASRSRKTIDYAYLEEALKEVKLIGNTKEKSEVIIKQELGVTTDVQATRGSGD